MGVEVARADLESAQRSNQRRAGSVSETGIRRLQAKLELAELRLELLRNPTYVPSLIDEMQWHIDQLTDEIIDLRHRLGTRGDDDFGFDN